MSCWPWILSEMEGKWPYSSYFVGVLFRGFVQNSTLQFLCSSDQAFSQLVHPYSNTGTVTTWKKSHFILKEIRFPYHFQSMRYCCRGEFNYSTTFKGLELKVTMALSCLKHHLCFICVHVETNASCCLFQALLRDLAWANVFTRSARSSA